MKRMFYLIILCLTFQISFGQADGIYRIKYIGKIKSESANIEKIKLPTTLLLHNLENEKSKKSFIEIEPKDNEINVEIRSHLTSNLYGNSESLLNYYKTKRKSIPIIFVVIENRKQKEIVIEIDWENIKISKINDGGFGNLYELELNEIGIK